MSPRAGRGNQRPAPGWSLPHLRGLREANLLRASTASERVVPPPRETRSNTRRGRKGAMPPHTWSLISLSPVAPEARARAALWRGRARRGRGAPASSAAGSCARRGWFRPRASLPAWATDTGARQHRAARYRRRRGERQTPRRRTQRSREVEHVDVDEELSRLAHRVSQRISPSVDAGDVGRLERRALVTTSVAGTSRRCRQGAIEASTPASAPPVPASAASGAGSLA